MPNTILLKGDGVYKEAAAAAGITPGHHIIRDSAGKFAVGPASAKNAYAMFALENEDVGKDLTSAYIAGDQVRAIVPCSGAEIYALVPASAAAIVIGDVLMSNGDGTLVKDTAPTVAADNVRRVIARALEAVDNSGGGTPARIKVEVL